MANYDFTGLMEEKAPAVANKYDFSGLMEADTTSVNAKKKAWNIQSPAELIKEGFSPNVAALLSTGQELSSPAWKYGNMLLGGLPDVALSKMGYEAPESDIKIATPFGTKDITGGVNMAANVAGFVRGMPMKIGGAIARAIPSALKGAPLLTKAGIGAAKGASQFGLASALHTPQDEFENWRGRAARGIGGAAVGTITGGVGGLVNHFTDLLSQKALLKTGEETRTGFRAFKDKLTTWFGGKLDKFQKAKPNQRVDISKQMKDFEKGLGDKSKFKSLLKSSPRLRSAYSKAQRGSDLTLRETQDLVNQLKSGVSESQLSGFKVRPSGQEVNEFIGSIQGAKHTAFPEVRFTDATYGKMSDYTNAVENFMKYGKTSQGLKSMMNNPEMRKSLQTILPKDTYDVIKETANAQKMSKEMWRGVDYLIRYGIIYGFIKNMVSNMKSDEGSEIQSGG